jgi:nanoRNase/pAp phosphatase (c-di-AMP/oligoRNAs hydrolase)
MNNLIKWEKLFNKKEIIHLIKLGKFYLQYDDTLTNINKKKYVFTTFPSQIIFEKYNDIFKKKGQYKVAVYTGSPCPSIRSLSEKIQLESDCDIFMIWNYQLDKKKTIITMRSNKVDISEIAKAFGGGGHEGASSFSTDISIDNLFDEIVPR